MEFSKILAGYQTFREKYVHGDQSVMRSLSDQGQKPQIMVLACCDSRVDPALILQCDPGDLFVVRNVANIVPPYATDQTHHGTSAALEFGIRLLQVEHLILLGHSQCGGIQALLQNLGPEHNDFITPWVSLVKCSDRTWTDADHYATIALQISYQHCLTFPWIRERIYNHQLSIHMWFFDIKSGTLQAYSHSTQSYKPLDTAAL